ncbi:LegC family aminotransferase [Polynucleobacter sp. AP-Kaivos-20-H2]|uniref:LegC family aminotransferase n=1 Tax=Polynucleobacter sp. AP-Kaivos-20-H2 TaxID=2689104 RepID=UPI001C0D3582|nr:LegC family aminotransferase [Polynucleobacter sp. AP-Kaivos-20-H2]MBU3604137.1 LegC family aminotransferase [Polynucleobacter sp. AP-Kaivos-20-H2]
MNVSQDTQLVHSVIDAITRAIGAKPSVLHEPCFQGNEWLYLKECLDSTFVSSVGKFVDRFESDLAKYTGAAHAVAVVNGTAALHVALTVIDVGKGDEVLVPAATFIATANAVSYCGATPHFYDCLPNNLGADFSKLRDYLLRNTRQSLGQCININTNKKIKAIIPMHVFGHPVEMDELLNLCKEFNIDLVEDAAESLGSFYRGRHTGTFGKIGVLSFNGNKIITTGGGGALLTNDSSLAKRLKHITTTAKISHPWNYYHDEIGYNYRLPNLNAALGCAQLEGVNRLVNKKRELYSVYKKTFEGIDGISLISEPRECKSNYWLQGVVIDERFEHLRDTLLKSSNEAGIGVRPLWTLMHQLEIYANCPRMDLTNAESMVKRVINIPSSPTLLMGS